MQITLNVHLKKVAKGHQDTKGKEADKEEEKGRELKTWFLDDEGYYCQGFYSKNRKNGRYIKIGN